MYRNDHDGIFAPRYVGDPRHQDASRFHILLREYCADTNRLLVCPMASVYRLRFDAPFTTINGINLGTKFTAWKHVIRDVTHYGSYGISCITGSSYADPYAQSIRYDDRANVPVLMDCVFPRAGPRPGHEPPEYDDALDTKHMMGIAFYCINRHDGGVNGLFLDSSVRKVGLKELWTLKWNPWYDTAGPWTRAGGVQPEDWPQWMRNFKDY